MNKSQVTFNAVSAIVQVVIVGLIYFVLYKLVLTQLGIELLGVWSLIVASTSVVSLANFGISSSIVTFVSTYYSRNRIDLVYKLIFTSLIFIFLSYTLLSSIIYFLGPYLLKLIIDEKYFNIALHLLPFSLLSLIINALSGVFSSAIDGIQKNYVKSYILILSSIVLLVLSILFTPQFGILGLVYAQVIQSIIVFLLTFVYFRKLGNITFDFKWNWDYKIFKEIFNFGIKIQISSVLEMTFEPVSKFLLTKFGGLAMLGYYEMATRLLVQLRSLIASAVQVMIPVIAESKVKSPLRIKEMYRNMFSLALFLDILLVTFIVVSAPLVSLFWIGHYEKIFVTMVILGAISLFINILTTPAYYNSMGEGKLNWIVLSILFSFILNILLSFPLGTYFGGVGIVVSFNIALVMHGLILLNSYHRSYEMSVVDIVSKSDVQLFLSSLIFMIFSTYFCELNFNEEITSFHIVTCLISFIIFAYSIFKNSTFTRLRKLVFSIIVDMSEKRVK